MSKLEVDDEDGGQGAVSGVSAAKRLRMSPTTEPTSVLLYNRSPSPGTSSSVGGAASSSAPEPPPISAEDWEAVLSGDMAVTASQDNSFHRWIMGEDDAFLFDPLLPPPCQEESLPPPPSQQQQQVPVAEKEDYLDPEAAVEELLEAARLVDARGSTGVLARLNHRLPSSPGHPPPLLRAAAHLRDALLPPPASSLLDVALKLAAHKALADASPIVQFASITSTQAILDALAGARRVHLVDLDMGIATQWPPLMQELARQWDNNAAARMKLTSLVSPRSSAPHPLELHLVHDGLTRFAAELGIPFEFSAVSSGDPAALLSASSPGEAVAVHLSPDLSPETLRVVKQLRPAVVVCVDHGSCADQPLSRHALNVVRSTAAFLESLDAAANVDAVAKIERFILRPRVERLLLLGHKKQPWRTMLASAGFAPVQLSSAAEAQAECLVRRTPAPGFHVHRNTQAALALRWQRSDLVTVSAWRCCSTE